MSVFRELDGPTIVVDAPISAIAAPSVAVGGFDQIPVLWNSDRCAGIAYGFKAALALPSGAGRRVFEIAIGRDCNGDAVLARNLISAIAFPARAERAGVEMAVPRYLDGRAGILGFQKAPFAIPTIAGCGEKSIRGNQNGGTGVIDFAKAATALPAALTVGSTGRIGIRR